MIKHKYISSGKYEILVRNIEIQHVNATKLSKYFKVKPMDWIGKPETIKLIEVLGDSLNLRYPDLLQVDEETKDIWMHPQLAIVFSAWMNPKFGILVRRQLLIKNYLMDDESEIPF